MEMVLDCFFFLPFVPNCIPSGVGREARQKEFVVRGETYFAL